MFTRTLHTLRTLAHLVWAFIQVDPVYRVR
jgi:hypothetical protein